MKQKIITVSELKILMNRKEVTVTVTALRGNPGYIGPPSRLGFMMGGCVIYI